MTRIALNGLGRIGKLVLRKLLKFLLKLLLTCSKLFFELAQMVRWD